jgi:hypothetical protein
MLALCSRWREVLRATEGEARTAKSRLAEVIRMEAFGRDNLLARFTTAC